MNAAAAAGHVCSCIRIHVIDIVQPPGIGISPIADMDAHETIVAAALAANSSVEIAKKACCDSRSVVMTNITPLPLVVFVVATPPGTRLVTPARSAVEPLVHAPQPVQPTRIGGIGVVDDAVLEHECAHARPFARVRSRVGSSHGREGGSTRAGAFPGALLPVVVLDALALLLLSEPDAEVRVEVAAVRGRPGKRPTHPVFVGLQLRERRPRHGP